jgi:hypothetical protein
MKHFIGVIHPECGKYSYKHKPKDRLGHLDIAETKLRDMMLKDVPVTLHHSETVRVDNHFQRENLEPYPKDIANALAQLPRDIDKPIGSILEKVKGRDGKWYVMGQQSSDAIEFMANLGAMELSLGHHDNPNTNEVYPLDVSFVFKGGRPETKLVESGNTQSKHFFETFDHADAYMRNHIRPSILTTPAFKMSASPADTPFLTADNLGKLIQSLPEEHRPELVKQITAFMSERDELIKNRDTLTEEGKKHLEIIQERDSQLKELTKEAGSATLNYDQIKANMEHMYSQLNPDAQELTNVQGALDLLSNPDTQVAGINQFAQMCSASIRSGRNHENEPLAPTIGTTKKRAASQPAGEVQNYRRRFLMNAGCKDTGEVMFN